MDGAAEAAKGHTCLGPHSIELGNDLKIGAGPAMGGFLEP